MTQTIELRVDPRTATEETLLRVAASTAASVDPNRIRHLRITRRSIDARQRRVMVNLSVRLWIDEEPSSTSLIIPFDYKPLPDDAPQAVVVGAGPAGLFAALGRRG
ncbi:MAG: FAD-binding protein, partial [Duncaniella sp.]|nr:FAD-binding protein [Duncaniella sp.]